MKFILTIHFPDDVLDRELKKEGQSLEEFKTMLREQSESLKEDAPDGTSLTVRFEEDEPVTLKPEGPHFEIPLPRCQYVDVRTRQQCTLTHGHTGNCYFPNFPEPNA